MVYRQLRGVGGGAIKSAHGLGMHMKSATESPSDTDTWPRGKHKLRPTPGPTTPTAPSISPSSNTARKVTKRTSKESQRRKCETI